MRARRGIVTVSVRLGECYRRSEVKSSPNVSTTTTTMAPAPASLVFSKIALLFGSSPSIRVIEGGKLMGCSVQIPDLHALLCFARFIRLCTVHTQIHSIHSRHVRSPRNIRTSPSLSLAPSLTIENSSKNTELVKVLGLVRLPSLFNGMVGLMICGDSGHRSNGWNRP